MDKKNNRLKNKLSIGLSLEISPEEYQKLFSDYSGYIHSLYFSPPLEGKYHSRTKISRQFEDPQVVENFYEILRLAKEEGILLDCVLNRPTIREEDVTQALPFIETIGADQITCLQKHVDIVADAFPTKDLIFSYNNDLTPSDINSISTKFGTVVVAKSFLRSPDLLQQVASRGFNLKPLVNNGCSYNCRGCQSGNRQCQSTFDRNYQQYGANYLYALQSFYPEELDTLLRDMEEENIPLESVKISNRTDGYTYLDKCISSYINLTDPEQFTDKSIHDYRLWLRLGAFNGHFEELDQYEIKSLKKRMR